MKMYSMDSCFSGFSVGAIFGGFEPILGSLSPVISGDACNVEDNNSFIYSRPLYQRFLSFVVA